MTEILIPQPQTQDIYSFGFGKDLNKNKNDQESFIGYDWEQNEVQESKITYDEKGGHTHNGINSTLIDGWIKTSEIWTYATASTLTIVGDKRDLYSIGDKIRFIQGTAKYFYISGISYSYPNTTITVPVVTDYTIANSLIVEPFYSKASTPLNFPSTFSWTPTFTGVSSQPTVTAIYSQVGKIAFISCFTSAAGVSDNAAFYITNLPAIPGQNIRQNCSQQMNNGGLLPNPAQLDIVVASTTMQIYKDLAQAAWTASGSKYVNFSTWYFL